MAILGQLGDFAKSYMGLGGKPSGGTQSGTQPSLGSQLGQGMRQGGVGGMVQGLKKRRQYQTGSGTSLDKTQGAADQSPYDPSAQGDQDQWG
jgi:hypothetical protein